MQLDATCTIREAAELKQQLLDHIGAQQPLLIDGSIVDKVDSAGVQLLVAFSLDCMERGIDFRWAGRSPALDRAIELLGVTPLVESPAGPAPTPAQPMAVPSIPATQTKPAAKKKSTGKKKTPAKKKPARKR